MELNIYKISVAHKRGGDKIYKIFDNSIECIEYCRIANEFGGDLVSDPLEAFIEQCKGRVNLK